MKVQSLALFSKGFCNFLKSHNWLYCHPRWALLPNYFSTCQWIGKTYSPKLVKVLKSIRRGDIRCGIPVSDVGEMWGMRCEVRYPASQVTASELTYGRFQLTATSLDWVNKYCGWSIVIRRMDAMKVIQLHRYSCIISICSADADEGIHYCSDWLCGRFCTVRFCTVPYLSTCTVMY